MAVMVRRRQCRLVTRNVRFLRSRRDGVPMHRELAGAAAGAAVCLSLVAGCSHPRPDLEDLKATPGASTAYPGAVVYQRGETEAQRQVDGLAPATITVYACTHDRSTTVLAWFDRTLTAQGWSTDPEGHQDRPGAFEGGKRWRQGDARFDLSFATPATVAFLAKKAHQPLGCPTGYETLAQIG